MKIQQTIEQKLNSGLSPSHLEVINESHMHSVPPNSETHFKVVVVSDSFDGKRQVGRHQLVYGLLQEELAGEVHALSLFTFTDSEWLAREQTVADSPECLGGSKADK
ncbi:DNA-binding transcriptional regulator BolA [Sinobacterium norvegicum]|uniref:DNA-binding transcriptional regulator BolA n=1 Tax=Sinobacterium norvegicum TaxID=1641715 RepID=A0ABN8EGP6_9GAMM|nr:BolA/IbaG family iron-sulfur metabolism protein [Sinobacterium norvegicum]CAH0990803.1 DNA-binding transcriptional regulator BolA [Sinobacterium norvegicum]